MTEHLIKTDNLKSISSKFGELPRDQCCEGKMYIDAGQAAIIRPNGKITQLATDKVGGCLGIIAENPQNGAMGLIHILANFGFSDLSEEWNHLIKPVIDNIAPEDQDINIRIFGGLYDDIHNEVGQNFINTLTKRINSVPNTNILALDVGDISHPTAVVINVEDASVTAGTEMVTSYEEVIQQRKTSRGQLIDISTFSKPDIPPLSFGLIYNEPNSQIEQVQIKPDYVSL